MNKKQMKWQQIGFEAGVQTNHLEVLEGKEMDFRCKRNQKICAWIRANA